MKILKPNIDDSVVYIPTNLVYIYVTDYKAKFILKKFKVRPGQHTWYWVPFDSDDEIDLSQFGEDLYYSFDRSINRAINNAYATVYMFNNMEEMVREWENITYKNNIQTVYKEEKNS